MHCYVWQERIACTSHRLPVSSVLEKHIRMSHDTGHPKPQLHFAEPTTEKYRDKFDWFAPGFSIDLSTALQRSSASFQFLWVLFDVVLCTDNIQWYTCVGILQPLSRPSAVISFHSLRTLGLNVVQRSSPKRPF